MTTTQNKNLITGTTAAPTGVSAAAVAGGGSFAGAVAFFWKITATGPFGESIASAEVTATPAAGGHAEITATFPAGTTGFKLYRGTVTQTENVFVASYPVGPGQFVVWDTGAASPPAATPPATAALATVTKNVTTPTKSGLPATTAWPAGQGSPMQLALLQAEAEWLSDASSSTVVPVTSSVALTAKKRAAAAGFLLQET